MCFFTFTIQFVLPGVDSWLFQRMKNWIKSLAQKLGLIAWDALKPWAECSLNFSEGNVFINWLSYIMILSLIVKKILNYMEENLKVKIGEFKGFCWKGDVKWKIDILTNIFWAKSLALINVYNNDGLNELF